jgi:hypothetical protein
LAHAFSPTAKLVVDGITKPPNPEYKTQEIQDLPAAFLQNRMLAHVKSKAMDQLLPEFFAGD